MKFKDLTGIKFNRLTVLKFSHRELRNNKWRYYWLCKCECGNEILIDRDNIKQGKQKSCGCFEKENPSRKTHGYSKTRIYRIYNDMKNRCYNKNNKRYNCYGSRGIIICDEWKNDFKAFYDWSMAHGYADNLTIDRIDVNGNYEPNNCRWATLKQQANNRRNNHYITYNNETHTISEWAEILKIKKQTLWARLNKGWSIENFKRI